MFGVARSLLSSKRRAATVLSWSRAVFYRAKASVIKLGLRCSLWFALDEWNLKVIFEVSAFLLEECLSCDGAMYIQSFTLTSYLWRHFILCSVLSIKLSTFFSSCKVLWMEFCDWMKTSAADVFFEAWHYVAKMSGIVFLGHNSYMRFLISV